MNEKFFRSSSQRKEDFSIFAAVMTFEIQNAINEAIRQYALTDLLLSEFAEFSKFAELSVSVSEFFTFENSKWNASEVEFFNSLYDEKSINID